MAATPSLTAHHGMKPKHNASGAPRVVYVQDLLDKWLSQAVARVISLITRPYVVHNGALGSFATVYLPDAFNHSELINKLASIDGIKLAIDRGPA